MSKDLRVLASGEYCVANGGGTLTGARRIAQAFLLELLTEQGSMQYLPQRGCRFLSRVRNARTEFDVVVAFAAARNHIRRSLRGDETTSMPASERYGDAQLSQIFIEDGAVQLEFTVKNVAGTFVRILAPIINL